MATLRATRTPTFAQRATRLSARRDGTRTSERSSPRPRASVAPEGAPPGAPAPAQPADGPPSASGCRRASPYRPACAHHARAWEILLFPSSPSFCLGRGLCRGPCLSARRPPSSFSCVPRHPFSSLCPHLVGKMNQPPCDDDEAQIRRGSYPTCRPPWRLDMPRFWRACAVDARRAGRLLCAGEKLGFHGTARHCRRQRSPAHKNTNAVREGSNQKMKIGDLVWVKVVGHPKWPGQVRPRAEFGFPGPRVAYFISNALRILADLRSCGLPKSRVGKAQEGCSSCCFFRRWFIWLVQ